MGASRSALAPIVVPSAPPGVSSALGGAALRVTLALEVHAGLVRRARRGGAGAGGGGEGRGGGEGEQREAAHGGSSREGWRPVLPAELKIAVASHRENTHFAARFATF